MLGLDTSRGMIIQSSRKKAFEITHSELPLHLQYYDYFDKVKTVLDFNLSSLNPLHIRVHSTFISAVL